MYSIYEVLKNESLNDVAKKLNVNVDELIELNGELDDITPGQLIIVPKQDSAFKNYTVKKGDNLYSIAQKYDTDTKTLELLNGLDGSDYIYPNQKILIPKEGIGIYVVNNRETIAELLDSLPVGWENINRLNKKIYLEPEQIIIYDKKDLK